MPQVISASRNEMVPQMSRLRSLLLIMLSCSLPAFAASTYLLESTNSEADLIKADNSKDLLQAQVNADDSDELKCIFHLKKAIALRAYGKKNESEQELQKAARSFDSAGKDAELPTLAYLAAANDACGNKSAASSYYAKLRKSLQTGAFNSDIAKGKKPLSYQNAMLEMAAYSVIVFNSYSASESIADTLFRDMEAVGKGSEPDAGRALTFTGMLQLKSGEKKKALETLRKAVEICSQSPSSEESLKAGNAFCEALFENSKYAEEKNLLLETITRQRNLHRKNPETVESVVLLHKLYLKTGKRIEAERLVQDWKAELVDSPTLLVALLNKLAESSSNQNDFMKSADFANSAERKQRLLDANKTAVNDLITHFYVLKDCGQFAKAASALVLENLLRRLEEPGAEDRIPIRGPQDGDSDGDLKTVEAEKLRKLELSRDDLTRALAAYKKLLEDAPEQKGKLQILNKLLAEHENL